MEIYSIGEGMIMKYDKKQEEHRVNQREYNGISEPGKHTSTLTGGRTIASDNQTRERGILHIIHRNGSSADGQFP